MSRKLRKKHSKIELVLAVNYFMLFTATNTAVVLYVFVAKDWIMLFVPVLAYFCSIAVALEWLENYRKSFFK